MNGWRKLAGGFACALALVAAALLGAGPAQAKPRRFAVPESFEMFARLPKSHGYTVVIGSTDHRHIELKATKGGLTASYEVVGRANRNRLDADFGRFGHVSLRFHAPQRKQIRSLQFCHGKPALREVGTMQGSIRFTGSNDFLDVSATRVHGVATHSYRLVCKPRNFEDELDAIGISEPHPRSHPGPAQLLRRLGRTRLGADEPEETLEGLVAKRGTETGQLVFIAFSIPEFLMILGAGERETVGRVHVSRGALAIADPRLLKFSKRGVHPQTATVKGPKPLAGRGRYSEVPGGKPSWTGSLRVPLPGEGTVPLTGPEFDVQVCQARTDKEAKSCLELALP